MRWQSSPKQQSIQKNMLLNMDLWLPAAKLIIRIPNCTRRQCKILHWINKTSWDGKDKKKGHQQLLPSTNMFLRIKSASNKGYGEDALNK